MRLSKITSEAIGEALPSAPKGPLKVVLANGERGTIDAVDLPEVVNSGGRVVSDEELKRESELATAADSPGTAFAAAALRDATFGLSDQIITKTGLASPQELQDLESQNPTASTLGQVAGTVAPFLVPGGAAAKIASATPIFAASKLGAKVGQVAGKALSKTTSNVVKKAVEVGAGSAVEGALYGVGQTISEDALGKAEFNAENLLANVGRAASTAGVMGGAFGALTPTASKVLEKAKLKADEFLNEVAQKGDIGIIKWAGADKKEFRKLFQRNDLDEKDISDHILSLTKGGGEDIGGLLKTSLDDVAEKNSQYLRQSGEVMDSAIKQLDSEFNVLASSGNAEQLKKGLIYGEDLARSIEDGALKEMGDIISPRKDALKKFADDLRELGVQRDELGNIVKRSPLSPSTLRSQSIEFGKLAKFDAAVATPIREAYAEGRFLLEKKLTDLMDSLDAGKGISSAYKQAKKDYAKGALTQDILENGLQKQAANNRGMSLTEGISAGTGAVIGGLPGAVAGYAVRRFSREQGDKLASFVLRKIEKANNAGKINISDTVDGFLNAGKKAGQIGGRVALRAVIASDVKDEKDIEDKIGYYSQSPDAIVNSFAEKNEDLFAVAPKTAQALQDRVLKAVNLLSSKIPKQDDSPFQDSPRSRSEIQKFKNYVEAVEEPYKVLANLKQGYFTPESGEVFREIYPELYNEIKNEFSNRMSEFKGLNEKQKAVLSQILQLDSRKAYSPQGLAVLQQVAGQGVARDLAGQQPQKVPVSGAKNMDQSKRTASGLDRVLNRP
jgi:hypothetical protein